MAVGAKALGMATVWKLNGRQKVAPAPAADFMIHDLWELLTLGLLPREQRLHLEREPDAPQGWQRGPLLASSSPVRHGSHAYDENREQRCQPQECGCPYLHRML